MEKYFKNNREIKKEIENLLGRKANSYEFKVVCYSHLLWDNEMSTDLEINIFKDNKYFDAITVASIEEDSDDNFWNMIEIHRKSFKTEKNKLYKYLTNHFDNIILAEDYVC